MVQGAGGAFLTMADLGRAIALSVSNSAAAGQVYNLGSLFMSWAEIGKFTSVSRIRVPSCCR